MPDNYVHINERKQWWNVKISRPEIWAVLSADVDETTRAEPLRWFQDRIARIIHDDFNGSED